MLNCIIIEDQPPAQRVLKKYIADCGTLNLARTFHEATEALMYLKSNPVDLIFLDIHLPKISGLDFLKALSNPPSVILTTAFPDYALESYDLNVVDYLLKPFSFQRFLQAVSKVDQGSQPLSKEYLFIKSGYEHIKVRIEDILYIHSDTDYTELVLPDQKLLSQASLRSWIEILSPSRFTQIHKSYVINVTKIERISGNKVLLSGDQKVPIGRAFKEDFVLKFIQ